MQTHIVIIKNSYIIKQVEARTFKFGKARDNGQADKLINNVKLTDLEYDRSMVYAWIANAVGNLRMAFMKYACTMYMNHETDHIQDTNHNDDDEDLIYYLSYHLSSKWPICNGDGFDSDCNEYIINKVISEFLSLSLPREADLYAAKAMQALKDAERKLYFKTA